MVLVERFVSSLAAGGNDGSTEVLAWTFAEMLAQMVAGQRSNVKADGTYTLAGAGNQTFVAVGATDLAPFIIEGYTTTPQDGGRPTIVATLGWFDWGTNTGAVEMEGVVVRNMIFNGSNDDNPLFRLANAGTVEDCDVENTSGTFADIVLELIEGSSGLRCSIKTDSSDASAIAVLVDSQASLIESAVKTATIGVDVEQGGSVLRCLVVSAGATASIGIRTGLQSLSFFGVGIVECTVFDFDDTIIVTDVATASRNSQIHIANCILYQATNGINNQDAGDTVKLLSANNALGAITGSFFLGFGDNPQSKTITLTANPFTSSGTDDFSLNNVAGGGALLRGAALQVPALLA